MTPTLHVLGTAQDGGIPHAGCGCPTCLHAQGEPLERRRVASIALVGATGRVLLVDATPDLPDQLADLAERLRRPPPALDALLLTHAHMGHYVGLAWLGRESMSTRGLPVRATQRMGAFLEANRPWAHLVSRGEIVLERIAPGVAFEFDGLSVEPFASPHRAEDTDTVGLDVRGPRRRAVYLPDADRFPDEIVARIVAADVALVDGTFHDASELPGRDLGEIPHPFVSESVARLAAARGRVLFTHLNHSNRLLLPDASQRPQLEPPFDVAAEGMRVAL